MKKSPKREAIKLLKKETRQRIKTAKKFISASDNTDTEIKALIKETKLVGRLTKKDWKKRIRNQYKDK